MAFPSDPLDVTIEAAFGADRTADPGTWEWTDLTDRWHLDEPLTTFTGRREGAKQAEPGQIDLVMKNTDGQLTPEDPRSQWWPHVDEGLPLRVTIDPGVGGPLVFGGFVVSITPRWPGGSAGQALVDVVAGGLIRQHARGQSPLRSAPERFIVANGPLGLWVLDDPDGSRSSRAVVGSPMRPAPAPPPLTSSALPGYGQGQVAPWLPPGIRCTTEAGTITAPVANAAAGLGWAVDVMYRADQSTTGTPPIASGILVKAGDLDFRALWGADDGFAFAVFDADGGLVDSALGADNSPLLDGQPHHLRWSVIDTTGTNTSMTLQVDGTTVLAATLDIGVTTTPAAASITLSWNGEVTATTPIQFSMLALYDGPGAPGTAATVDAYFGHRGEPAVVRAQRVCTEEGVALIVVGDPADSEPMGPQQPGALLALLRECEAADDGILAEQQFGFWLRTRVSRYNQDPALVIDAAARQLGRAFEPVRDDQRTRNEWTLTQLGGNAQVTVRDLVDQQRRGVKDDQLDVNVASAGRLLDRAHWELSRSTMRQLRYPALTVHLHSSPGLLAQVMATRLGDRVQLVNPPRQHPPGPVDQVAEGIRHTIIGRRKWTWEAVVAPYAPWQVGVWAADVGTPAPDAPSRYSPADSRLIADFEAGVDTTLQVSADSSGGDDHWTFDPATLPFDVNVAGVRLRVTAVGPVVAFAQDLTVAQQPINGVTKTIVAPTPVELWQPARYAL